MKKIVVFAAGRPDFARLSCLIKKLDEDPGIECVFVNSGQHSHTDNLDKTFIENLKLRAPDYNLDIGSDNADWNEQIARIFQRLTPLLKTLKPLLFLNLGDMNPCLSGLVAKRLGIPYMRIECGMRSGTLETAYKNFSLPEEINRCAMDSIADLKICYLPENKVNLVREGHLEHTIKVVGNTILDALDYYTEKWNIQTLCGDYDFVSFHRGNNMNEKNLRYFVDLINTIAQRYKRKIKFVCYGRTRKELEQIGLFDCFNNRIQILDSQTQEDFLRIIARCNVVLSDSGSTSSEESHYFHKPALILRDSTERPSTLINNSIELGNAYLWTMDLEQDLVLYQKLNNMERNWNNRYLAAPNGRTVAENIVQEIKRFLKCR